MQRIPTSYGFSIIVLVLILMIINHFLYLTILKNGFPTENKIREQSSSVEEMESFPVPSENEENQNQTTLAPSEPANMPACFVYGGSSVDLNNIDQSGWREYEGEEIRFLYPPEYHVEAAETEGSAVSLEIVSDEFENGARIFIRPEQDEYASLVSKFATSYFIYEPGTDSWFTEEESTFWTSEHTTRTECRLNPYILTEGGAPVLSLGGGDAGAVSIHYSVIFDEGNTATIAEFSMGGSGENQQFLEAREILTGIVPTIESVE